MASTPMYTALPLEGYYVFDPEWPLDMHLVADELAYDYTFAVPLTWTTRPNEGWFCPLPDDVLLRRTERAREVVKLPLTGMYREVAFLTLDELEEALDRRKERRRRALQYADREPWTPTRFRDMVEARCGGPGIRKGKATWFRCPWHDDSTPSLEVDFEAMVWHCWSQCGGGGWRKWGELERADHRRAGGKQVRV